MADLQLITTIRTYELFNNILQLLLQSDYGRSTIDYDQTYIRAVQQYTSVVATKRLWQIYNWLRPNVHTSCSTIYFSCCYKATMADLQLITTIRTYEMFNNIFQLLLQSDYGRSTIDYDQTHSCGRLKHLTIHCEPSTDTTPIVYEKWTQLITKPRSTTWRNVCLERTSYKRKDAWWREPRSIPCRQIPWR